MKNLQAEIGEVVARLRNQFDVAPYLESWHATSEMDFRLLPSSMAAILQASPDWHTITPGTGPVWLQLETDDRHGQLVVYRTLVDDDTYALIPASGDKIGT